LLNYIKYQLKPLCLFLQLCCVFVASGQPVANFSATPLSGCAPLTVQFTDNSTGNPTSWNWNFGNNTTATQKNPIVTYSTPGIYTVSLTVSNSSDSSTIIKNQYITVYERPAVEFSVNDSLNCIPFTTRFTDHSSSSVGSIISWQWDFDDGSTSTLQNPQHLYTQAGNFNITLQVTNSGGCTSSLSKLAYIKAADSIRTQFNFSQPEKCKPPETIFFYNNTVGPGITTYTWNFGNGVTLNSFSPSHTYNTGGLYTITLTAKNDIGCTDTLVLKDTLFIKNVRSSIISEDTVCSNYRMLLSNATIPAPLTSQWQYSDGTYSFSSTTAKTWSTPGNYTVRLISNFNACSDSVTKRITVLPAPAINFSASDSVSCRVPFTVNFTDLTTNAANWLWDFGDGYTSNLKNPVHTFTSESEFNIKLAVSSAEGCSSTLTQPAFIKAHKPFIDIDTKEKGGCLPYTFMPVPAVNAPDGIAGYLWDFGNGNSSTNPLPVETYTTAGNYNIKLTINTVEGCIDSLVIPSGVRTAGNKPVMNFSASPAVVCPGSDVQFTNLSVPSDKWLWKFGDGTSELQNPDHVFYDSGRYSIKLIAWNNGCSDSIIKYQVVNVLPGYARFRTLYNCNNKREVAFIDSSVSPQTWLWDFGDGTTDNTQNPLHVFPGYQTYYVSLTTTNGSCTNTATMAVNTVNEIPGFSASKTSVCKMNPVSFFLQGINKNNIKKYTWNFGDGVTDSLSGDSVYHTYTQPGYFTIQLTVIDTNGCSETVIKTNYIYVSSPKAGFTAGTTGGCRNKPVSFTNTSVNTSGNNNITNFLWDFGDGQTQSFEAPITNPVLHTYNITGYYYPSLKIIDSVGCADSISFTSPVRIYQPIANFFASNFNTCIVDTLILRNLSTGIRLSYLWDFGDGTISNDSLPIKNYTVNGDYTVKLLVTDIAGCRDSMVKVNYAKVRDVVASFTANNSTGNCIPLNVKFNNNSLNALSQLWSFGDGSFSSANSPVYTYINRGIYTVYLTAKRSARCFDTDSINIVVNGPLASLQYNSSSGCAPLTVPFTVITSDPLTYSWDFNDGVVVSPGSASIAHTYTRPGVFIPSVIIKDSTGCIVQLTGRDSVHIYSSKVNFDAIDTDICFGDSTYFSDSTISGSSITSYRWLFGDDDSSALQSPVHFYNSPGTYTVKLFVTTSYGCTDSLIKTNHIRIFTRPQISIAGNNSTYCGQSTITFTGNITTTDTAATYWKWDFDNGVTSTLQNPPEQLYTDTGIYFVRLKMQYETGCADSTTTNFRLFPLPNTYAGNDTAVCDGNTVYLQATGADNYSWQPADYLSCTNCENPLSATVDNINYTVTGANNFGCTKKDSIRIIVKKPFIINLINNTTSVCAGKSIQLSVSGADHYTWSPATGLDDANIVNPVATPTSSITYTVTGSDSLNCFQDTSSVYVQVNPNPRVNAGPDIISPSAKQVTLSPQYSNDIVRWLWQPAIGLSCIDCPSPVASPSNGVMYKIEVTNIDGCTNSDYIFVELKCDRGNIYMPTAFSPNGYQVNRNFCPLTLPGTGTLTISAFKIYNRIGQLVFQSGNFNTNDHSAGWDGKINGVDAPAGAYVYTVEFVCSGKKTVAFNGNILLLR
jgi:gliding motility-associated-like protein